MPKNSDNTKMVSRRTLVKGAAALTIAAAARPLSGKTPTTGAKAAPPATDTKSYRALALFLTFTTNPSFFDNAGSMDQTIATRLNVSVSAVKALRELVISATPKTYDQIRHDFNTIATSVGYSGPQCPTTFETLGAIADLYH